jgi:hypothetical protein
LFICFVFSGRNWGADRHLLGRDAAGYQKIVEMAQAELGVREKGHNDGGQIRAYLAYVGIKHPAAWCAAWVSFVHRQAGYTQPKTAWSPSLFPASRLVKNANHGLVFGIHYKALNRIGHCGIIERVDGDWLRVIEGNTNIAGSREGDGVFRRVRHQRTISCFSDWTIRKL